MRRLTCSLAAPLLACVLLGHSPDAHAADPRADAQVRQEEGIKRYSAGDLNGALSAFTQAYAIYPSPKILWNLVVTELDLGKQLDAVRNLHLYLASTDPAITTQKRDAARTKLEDARKKLGGVQIEAPQGARVSIDGKPFPPAYQPDDVVELESGSHSIVMETASQRKERAVSTKVGEVTRVAFDDTANAAANPAAPPVKPETPPPAHKDVEPPPSEPERSGLACPHSGTCVGATIALTALGVVGAVGAIAFNAGASSAKTDADALHEGNGACNGSNPTACPGAVKDLDDRHSSRLTLSRVSLGVGAASLIGAGVVFFAWPSKSNKESSARLVPVVSPNTAGMGISGRF